MNTIVSIDSVVKRYGNYVAVDNLTFDVPLGGIFAMLGPNGAGKTTLIKLMMGMLVPTSGQIRINGLDAFRESVDAKRIVGYLPDEPVFFDFMRGREIIRFVGEMHGLDRRTIESRCLELAERLSLSDALNEFAENYSRGMKKKLGLICALLHQPQLVILDEPTNGLDPQGTYVLHELMKEIAASNRTVLFSTHLLDQAQRLCDQIAVINHGTLAANGTLAELQSEFGTNDSLESLFFRLTDSANLISATHSDAELEGVLQ